jgi:hypothetical protein
MGFDALVAAGSVALLGAVMIWYWPHCARPALWYVGSNGRVFNVLKVVGAGSWALAAFTALQQPDSQWRGWSQLIATGGTFFFLAAWPFPRPVAALAGGYELKVGLRRYYGYVSREAQRAGLTFREFGPPSRRGMDLGHPPSGGVSERLRRHIDELDRFRTAETTEWIDLVQSELLDWADDQPVDPIEARARSNRIMSLGNQLFPGSGRVTLADAD